MAIYFVTGALGAGKSLISVSKIQDKLVNGCIVATNLDLKPWNMPRVGAKAKNINIYRIPDKPDIDSLNAIGRGNITYDERKNGLLVLDECGTWLNTRTWNDKSRMPVIEWFLHARKLGWDIIFLVQNISLIDKQAREALAEHVVYCRRLDRLTIPFIGSLFSLIFGTKMPMPKIHLGIVKYGDSQHSPIVERWVYRGADLYHAYDTKQQFSTFYNKGVFNILPPYLTHGRYQSPLSLKKIMKLTKIYLKRLSRVRLLFTGVIFGLIIGYFCINITGNTEPTEVISAITIKEMKINSFKWLGNELKITFINDKNEIIDFLELSKLGYKLEVINSCNIRVYNKYESKNITC